VYLGIAVFAPVLLGLYGPGFGAAQTPLLILAVAGLVATGVGPVDVVLLMAGKSSWNLANTAVALTLNVVLNVLLIPHLGMTGAAIAWAASLLANNLLPLWQVRRLLGIHPFGPAYTRAAVAALSAGGAGLLSRLALGPTWGAVAVAALAGATVFILLVRRGRDELQLSAFLRSGVSTRKGAPS
jgi:O-antigen/teichoic acid export membrane protein